MGSGNSYLKQKKIVDDCVKEVVRLSSLVSLVISAILGLFWGRYICLAYLSGALVSIINFLLLRYQTEFLVRIKDNRRLIFTILAGYVFRFGLMGLFLFLMGKHGIQYLLSAGAGLLAVRLGIFVYGFLFQE